MLASAVIDRVLLQLAEDSGVPNYLSRAELLTILNSCNRILVEFLDCFTRFGHIVCKANKPKYTLDSSMRTPLWVTYDGEYLQPASIRAWEKYSSSWRGERGTPTEYCLDAEKKHVLWLYKCPDTDGDEFIKDASTGVPYEIIDPVTLSFDAQTQEFTNGQIVTGTDSGATGTLIYVSQNGYDGKLYFETITGTFTDNEIITDALGGSATADGTQVASGGSTWTFSRTTGLVGDVTGGNSFWDIVDDDGEETDEGTISEIWSPVKNVLYKYSYYPDDLTETDHLYKPYRNAEDLFFSYCMFQALMVEAEGQDMQLALHYLGQFATMSGIEIGKLWTPQREFVMGSYAKDSSKERVRLPDDYGPTEY